MTIRYLPKPAKKLAWQKTPIKDTEPYVQHSLSGHTWKRVWGPQGSSWRGALCLYRSRAGEFIIKDKLYAYIQN